MFVGLWSLCLSFRRQALAFQHSPWIWVLCNSINGRPNIGLQHLYSAETIFTLFFPPNRMLQNSADFESRKIFWGLQTKSKFWTELNHCFFLNVYGRENLICSKWSSLLCQCFRCGLGYLHQENIISAHCTSCNSLTLLTFFLYSLHSLKSPLFHLFSVSHAFTEKCIKSVATQQNKKHHSLKLCPTFGYDGIPPNFTLFAL